MSKVPAPTSPVNPRRAGLLLVVVVAYLALTGAGVEADASRTEMIMYLLAAIVAVKIVIKLIVPILQAIVVLAAVGLIYYLVKVAVDAVGALIH